MKLSKRLNAIAAMVEQNAVVADVGCDHAQLCIALISSKKIQKAYACDVRIGPLSQAKKNIEYYNLEQYIIPVLSDGMEKLEDDVTTVVIAGMGYETVQQILDSHPEKLIYGRKFIIQVNKEVERLRKWISDHRYLINKECVIFEDGHYYQIIAFQVKEDVSLNLDQLKFGKQMEKDDIFYSYWRHRWIKNEKIIKNLDRNHPKYYKIEQEMKQIYEELMKGSEG